MTEIRDIEDIIETNPEFIQDINVILPVGGRATRALEITEDKIPKHLIQLKSGQVVLDRIMHGLQNAGYRKFIFCTGHHSEILNSYIETDNWKLSDDSSAFTSHEDYPLGPDGAVIKAIKELNLAGDALVLPGDISLPWNRLAIMSLYRQVTKSDVTLAVTSQITPRTTDIGKIIVNKETSELEQCYGRDETVSKLRSTQVALTSAAAMAIDIDRYLSMCKIYKRDNPAEAFSLSMRDGIAPWASGDVRYKITAYDVRGEILDLGTPSNIRFGQKYLDD
jgi:NDP-sugar pyrophosphorylase family protein